MDEQPINKVQGFYSPMWRAVVCAILYLGVAIYFGRVTYWYIVDPQHVFENMSRIGRHLVLLSSVLPEFVVASLLLGFTSLLVYGFYTLVPKIFDGKPDILVSEDRILIRPVLHLPSRSDTYRDGYLEIKKDAYEAIRSAPQKNGKHSTVGFFYRTPDGRSRKRLIDSRWLSTDFESFLDALRTYNWTPNGPQYRRGG